MRLLARVFALLATPMGALIFAACAPEEPVPADVCAQATQVFTRCGVTLPLLADRPCTGATRAVARCVAAHAKNCEDLANLTQRLDACVAEELDGGDLTPAEDLPFPTFGEAGADAAFDAGAAGDATTPFDAGPTAMVDAGVDAGWPGIDVTATVAIGVEDRYVTPLLPAGAYTFAITGTGDADLYVKQTSKPTTVSYDRRPFLADSNESCTISLTSPTVVFVMVRGAATTSTYTLKGHP